jgi:hypothetical protein
MSLEAPPAREVEWGLVHAGFAIIRALIGKIDAELEAGLDIGDIQNGRKEY